MAELAFALENIGHAMFEKLAMAYLRHEGYDVHESGHSAADGGWDARISINGQEGIAHASVRKDWQQKIREDANKVSELEEEFDKDYDMLVFVTNQEVKGRQELDMEKEIRGQYGWNLKIYHRSNLIGEMRTNHPELAEDFLDLKLKADDDHFEKLLDLRNNRIQKIRQRSGGAAKLEQGPVIALHVIPNGIFSQKRRKYSGEVPGPPVLWELNTPYHEVRGKHSYASVPGRLDGYCWAYGFIRNDGLYETAKLFASYSKEPGLTVPTMLPGREEISIPLDVSKGSPGFDAYTVITVRRVLGILKEIGFDGSALVSVSLLDAPELRYERRTQLSNFTGEPLGKERYVTDSHFVNIHGNDLLSELKPLLDEVWRELGLREGTKNIVDGKWVGDNITMNDKKLL